MEIRKILIIGISGTGKTTLARKLCKLFNIPVYHLDKFIWKENWLENLEPSTTSDLVH